MSDGEQRCAHAVVHHDTGRLASGTMRSRWCCVDCGQDFDPVPVIDTLEREQERDRLAERLFVQDWDSTMDESAWAEEVRRAYAAADAFLKVRAEQREEGEG